MEPTNEWDRDEVFERIPWKHLSRDIGKLSVPPRVLALVGLVVVVLAGLALAFLPESTRPAQAVLPAVTVPIVAPTSTTSAVVTIPPSPISEADLYAEAPGAGELRAMMLAESHLRSVMSSELVYVEWTRSFEVSAVGDEWWVDVMAGLLRVEDGMYFPMSPLGLRVGVDADGVLWSTPIGLVESRVHDVRVGGAEISSELLAEFSESVSTSGLLVEVVDAGLLEGALWGLVTIETPDGVMITLEVWPDRS
jgi:hypothetical protein